MTAPKLPAAVLPDWPRLMSRELAAAYLGVGPSMVDALPIPPLKLRGRVLYDRKELDRWVDEMSGGAQRGDPSSYLSLISQCGT